MFKLIRTLLTLMVKGVYGNVTPYGSAYLTGVFDSMINIDYGDEVYRNKVLHAPLLYIIDMLRSKPAKTTRVLGFDEIVQKHILSLGANQAVATVAGAATTLTMAADEKHNVVVNQIIEFNFTPTTGYTNMVYVSSKAGATTALAVTPIDSTLKFGTESGATIPAGTMMNCLGTYFGDYSTSVDPISTSPTTIENYVQYFKTPFAYGEMAAKEHLYIKGTIMNRLETDKRAIHLSENEGSLLFQGPKWRANIEASTDTTQNATMEGLIYAIKNGSSPALKSYETWSEDVFDQWQWTVFDPELEDQVQKRFLICNKAMRKFFTDLKKNKPGVELAKNDTYGIPGIKTIETDAGTFDLLVHPKIHRRWPSKDLPVGVTLTLPMLEFKPYIPTYLAMNIQTNETTGRKAEFRTAWTYLLYNRNTAYHGMVYNT
jgi:hypothetical protein